MLMVSFPISCADKQQELDLPSLRVDDSETARASSASRKAKEAAKDGSGSASSSASAAASCAQGSGAPTPKPAGPSPSPSHVGRAMSHISGVKRPLSHSNSVTADKVAKYGVETPNEHELGKVSR